MQRKAIIGILVLALTAPMVLAAGESPWLHIKVMDGGEGGETVRVNIPLSLAEAVLPLVEIEMFHKGKLDLNELINQAGDMEIDIRGILEEVRKSGDAELVNIQKDDQTVRVVKSGDFLVVKVTDKGGSETVDVRLPLKVVDALISGEEGELDLIAGVRALGESGGGDLVSVQDGDESVRIWVDYQNSME